LYAGQRLGEHGNISKRLQAGKTACVGLWKPVSLRTKIA